MKNLKIFSGLLLILSPILSLFVAILDLTIVKRVKSLNSVIFILCIVLSLINCTKIIEGDLILYLKQFNMADKYSYFEYLIFSFKDPVYYSFKYFFYNFISSDFSLFLFSVTFISYWFLLKGVLNFASIFSIKITDTLLIILLVAFFPQIFSFSAHLVRQFIAISIGFYALSEFYSKNSKKSIFLLLLSILIHSSNLIFVLFFIHKINVKKSIYYAIIFSVISSFFFSSKLMFIFNGFNRINNLTSGGAVLKPVNFFVVFLVSVFFLISVHLYIKENKNINKKYFLRSSIFLNFLFFSLVAINSSELSNRILPIIYLFWPFLVFMFLERLKITKLLKFIVFLILIMFVYNVEYGKWQYNSYDLVMFPVKRLLESF